jgi:hypothetical protein
VGRLPAVVVVALAVATSIAALAAAAGLSGVTPPAPGGWRAVADRSDTGGNKPIYDFSGTFTVSGGHVTKLQGTITHTYPHDEGCVTGTKVTILGSQPIVHETGDGFDSYDVVRKAPGTFVPVTVRVVAGKQTVPGTLDIRFNEPGAIPSGSSITFGNTIGCHLQFDVVR